MGDRERELRQLADRVADREAVVDAWTAKSFTDRLFIVDVESGAEVSEDLRETLREHGLRGYNEVHDVGTADGAFAGNLDDRDRYQFVDVRARGELQSYVVE